MILASADSYTSSVLVMILASVGLQIAVLRPLPIPLLRFIVLIHFIHDLNVGINMGDSRSVLIVCQSVICHLACVRLLPAYFQVFDAVSDSGIHVPTHTAKAMPAPQLCIPLGHRARITPEPA